MLSDLLPPFALSPPSTPPVAVDGDLGCLEGLTPISSLRSRGRPGLPLENVFLDAGGLAVTHRSPRENNIE